MTVFAQPGAELRAALGSPADPEAFVAWRAHGVTVFLAGEVPLALELAFDERARVVGTATYQ